MQECTKYSILKKHIYKKVRFRAKVLPSEFLGKTKCAGPSSENRSQEGNSIFGSGTDSLEAVCDAAKQLLVASSGNLSLKINRIFTYGVCSCGVGEKTESTSHFLIS